MTDGGDEADVTTAADADSDDAAVASGVGQRFYLLQDLLEQPELLAPPPQVIPRLAWEGRVTLIAAPEKSGKSTLLGQAVAALVQAGEQRFLGELVQPNRVAWLALDEPLGDVARRLDRFHARAGVLLYTQAPTLEELEQDVHEQDIGVLVIDTLTEFAASHIQDPNSAMQWQPVLKALRGIAQRTGVAIILLHHMGRQTRRYRDSSQIGAGVDVIVEMSEDTADPVVRRCRVRGRVDVANFGLRYVNARYDLHEDHAPLRERICRAVEAAPGIGKGQVRKVVGGKASAVDAELKALMHDGVIEDRGTPTNCAFYATGARGYANAERDPYDRDKAGTSGNLGELSDVGQTGSSSGQGLGQAPLVPLSIREQGQGQPVDAKGRPAA